MIYDTLKNAARYSGLGTRFQKGFQFLQNTDLSSLKAGRIELDGANLFALVQEYTTRTLEESVWEAHRNYIDIQYMVSGVEKMGFANLEEMDLGGYIPERDFQALNGRGNEVTVSTGAFAIFFPEDGHMPGLRVDQPAAVKKVVLKLKIDPA